MGVSKCSVDTLIFNSEAIESLVRAKTGENLLKLSLEFLICDGLNTEFFRFVTHCSFTF